MGNGALLMAVQLRQWYELRKGVFGRAGYVKAVDGVTFELAEGEAIAVVGESGCGKTSLAKTVVGLYRPTGGELYFDGKPLHSADAATIRWYRRQVGFVQQDPYGALPPFMNVRRILQEPLIIHGMSKEDQTRRIREVMEEVKLVPVDEFLPKFPHMLSGGQQQRVVIARAILLRPRLIVADEPVSMLDASVRVEILELLRNLQSAHKLAVIYITHDLSTVRHFSERIFVMYGGLIVEKARVTDLLKNTLHPYTQALLQAIPDADAANAETDREVPPGEPPSLLHPPAGCRFHPRCPKIIRGECEVRPPPEFQPEPEHSTMCFLYGERKV
jgi:peptide/nickel transport system ATP-binding protein